MEAYFIKTYTPPTAARAPFVVGALASVGYCDLQYALNMSALTRDDMLATWSPEESLEPIRELQDAAKNGTGGWRRRLLLRFCGYVTGWALCL